MTRGKYKSTAEARRAREGAEAKAVRLERENGILSRENDQIKTDSMKQHAAHLAEINQMRIALATGAEPELARLREREVEMRAELADYETYVSEIIRMHDKGNNFLMGHFTSVHHFTVEQAMDVVGEAYETPERAKGVLPDSIPINAVRKMPDERVEVLRRVRNSTAVQRRLSVKGRWTT
jgi:hypothetical protein